jgi:hypothetical protein
LVAVDVVVLVLLLVVVAIAAVTVGVLEEVEVADANDVLLPVARFETLGWWADVLTAGAAGAVAAGAAGLGWEGKGSESFFFLKKENKLPCFK